MTRTLADIARDPQVGLTLQGKAGMLGMRPLFVTVEGKAEPTRDKAAFAAHWNGRSTRLIRSRVGAIPVRA